jgi:hypothetical protein
MNEGMFYGLFFTGILLNYAVKLNIESKGNKLDRSNLREGIVMGVSAYPLYQTIVVTEISTQARVIDSALGLSSFIAGGVFFVNGRLRRDSES